MSDAISNGLNLAARAGSDGDMVAIGIREMSASLAAAAARIELVEDGVGRAPLADLLGYLSSVQGTAAGIGLETVELIARQIEGLLDRVMDEGGIFSRAALDTLVRGVDIMTLLVRDLERQRGGHVPAALGEAVDRLLEDIARVSAPRAGAPPPRLRLVRRRTSAIQPSTTLDRTLDQVCDVGRYTSRRLGKDIIVETAGGDLTVAVRIAEAVAIPLEQLVRSSVEHGIEPSVVRAAIGKPKTGRVDVTARLDSGHLVLEVADDGALLELAKTPRPVEPNNRASGDSAARVAEDDLGVLSARELIIGLVRRSVEDLGGSLDVSNETGLGTRIVLRLSLSPKERRRS